MPRSSHKLIIKHHQPVRFWLVTMMYVAIFGAIAWFLFVFGQEQAGFNNTELTDEIDRLSDYSQEMEKSSAKLREKVAMLSRSQQIEAKAYGDVDKTLKDLQQEILELKEEVAFYRGIVSPKESAGGLKIQSFVIENTGENQKFRFKLVLTQVMNNQRVVKGKVKLAIEGIQQGKTKKLSLKSLSDGSIPNIKLKFKYFQNIEGNIVIPLGFEPSRVFIEVNPTTKKVAKVKKTFNWKEVAI